MIARNLVFAALFAWSGLGVILVISAVGQPRKPITPAIAVGRLLVQGLFIWGLAFLWKS